MTGVTAALAGAHRHAPDPRRRAMALRGFLSQNVAIGTAFGTFGVAVLPLQEHYGVGRGWVTMALAVAMLAMALSGSLVATLLARIGTRATLLAGAALSTAGYVLLAFAPNFWVVLFAYGVPVGLGMTMMGPLPVSVLAARWFAHSPGPAVGFVNMPAMLIVVPLASVPLLASFGLTGMYLAGAILHVAIMPVLLGISDGPDGADQAHGAGPQVPARQILSRPVFWVLVVGGGLLNALGIIGSSNIVALGIERGIPADSAALFASIMGAASVAGAFGAGLLCARIGGAATLAVIGAMAGIGWSVLSGASAFSVIAMMTMLLGLAGAGVFPAVNVLAAEKFGPRAVAQVLGLFGTAALPFGSLLPPVAGAVADAAGRFDPVIAGCIAASVAVIVIFVTMARVRPALAPL